QPTFSFLPSRPHSPTPFPYTTLFRSNKHKIPGDTRGATVASGVRLGSNTAALRRMGPEQMERCASLLDTVLTHARTLPGGRSELPGEVREHVVSSVRELCRDVPLPYATATENL